MKLPRVSRFIRKQAEVMHIPVAEGCCGGSWKPKSCEVSNEGKLEWYKTPHHLNVENVLDLKASSHQGQTIFRA